MEWFGAECRNSRCDNCVEQVLLLDSGHSHGGAAVAGVVWRCTSHDARGAQGFTRHDERNPSESAQLTLESEPPHAPSYPKKQGRNSPVESGGSYVKASQLPNQGQEVVGALQVELSAIC